MAEQPVPSLSLARIDDSSPLSAKQRLFVRCLAALLHWFLLERVGPEGGEPRFPGAELRLGEGYVGDSIDKPHEDTPHLRHGGHFSRLAIDLMLDVDGRWITGDHPLWHELGRKWLSLHPLCAWGGQFSSGDFNHFSIRHGGVS